MTSALMAVCKELDALMAAGRIPPRLNSDSNEFKSSIYYPPVIKKSAFVSQRLNKDYVASS